MNIKLARDHNFIKIQTNYDTLRRFSLPVSIYLFALVFVMVRNKQLFILRKLFTQKIQA